ncbi:TrkA C-terminal domain-containing protein [Haloarcula nitratireducens]|uniref:cation:proton antiporter regulatory subunit n=1 Tax=Haloarcula nitratireducens TaxID=2487749 RepID=UPI002E2856FC|nr:TrkA C-terminal domain-containing protein [Halomicroarcula nitratireducens]
MVVTAGSDLVGETVGSSRFQDQYQTAVLAIRRGGETAYERLTEYRIRPGDLLLIESEPDTVDRLADDPNVIVADELALQQFRSSKLLITVGVVLGEWLTICPFYSPNRAKFGMSVYHSSNRDCLSEKKTRSAVDTEACVHLDEICR